MYDILGVSGAAVQTLLLLLAVSALTYILRRRFGLLRLAAAEPRGGHWGERLRRLLVIGFGQARQPRYLVAGVLHIILFAGFWCSRCARSA